MDGKKDKKTAAKDVLPNITTRSRAVQCTPIPPTRTEWFRLLLRDVICSQRITVHFQWGENLSLVTLTFDLNIQTRPSEGPSTSSV